MKTINVSTGKNNNSQRNNEIRGSSACNATSGAMFIKYGEKKLPFCPQGTQLEDFIMATLIGKEGYNEMFRVADTLYPDYSPNEIHACLAWGINRVMEKEIAIFKSNWSLQDFVFSLVKGKPVIVSGKFGSLHHIVCLVGLVTSQEDIESISKPEDVKLNKIKKFIFDDPWGDPNTNYTSHSGNDIEFSYKEFVDTMKPQGQLLKWGHLHSEIVSLIQGDK